MKIDLGLLGLWLAVGLLFSVIVGVAGGVLAWLSGQRPAAAIIAGGMAFGGAFTLVLAVIGLFLAA
ncbi:hypothetical protein [Phytohabitans aurantiacus]|uniref:hypothetical protein n=1 Tax=Phytohabitans aurantiacus TaxID=3016789 RepID=UPI00249236ED|nr:hypothetical protein [Phytohabitans aurantiacus]